MVEAFSADLSRGPLREAFKANDKTDVKPFETCNEADWAYH